MEENKSTKAKRISFFIAGALMLVSALLYWICDIGTVCALCLGAAGVCFFCAGLSVKDDRKQS